MPLSLVHYLLDADADQQAQLGHKMRSKGKKCLFKTSLIPTLFPPGMQLTGPSYGRGCAVHPGGMGKPLSAMFDYFYLLNALKLVTKTMILIK